MQDRIGAKTVGVLTLELAHSAHRVELIAPDGLVRHNIMDHAVVYPKLAAIRAALGARAELSSGILSQRSRGRRA